ncbi:hypothetical protein, partial [Vibrio vulnificus]|uniref:hypothetical protein n=1 Tax=Vibrio vulnificus TaxID=672 RepID=UPI0019D4DFD3
MNGSHSNFWAISFPSSDATIHFEQTKQPSFPTQSLYSFEDSKAFNAYNSSLRSQNPNLHLPSLLNYMQPNMPIMY